MAADYRGVTKHNGAECDAGRRLLHWARQDGFQTVEYSTSNWTYATPADLDWWCDLWADPVIATRFADQAVEFGLSDRDELSVISAAWRAWGSGRRGVRGPSRQDHRHEGPPRLLNGAQLIAIS